MIDNNERWEYEPSFKSISSYDGQDVIVQSLEPYDTKRLMLWPVGESYEKGFMVKVGDKKLVNTDRRKEYPKWVLYKRVNEWVKVRSQTNKPKDLTVG